MKGVYKIVSASTVAVALLIAINFNPSYNLTAMGTEFTKEIVADGVENCQSVAANMQLQLILPWA